MLNEKAYAMPAEWETHERTLIEWPVRSSMIYPENYEAVCLGYAGVVRAVSEFEKVTLIVSDETLPDAKRLCGSEIEYLTIPHNDAWCRDNGPTFLLDKEKRLSAVNWQFNAWGGKYPEFKLDNLVAPEILKHFKVPYFDSPIVLEGGSIHVDGEGTLLTTRECLLNKNRNPSLSEQEIAGELKKRLGVSEIIWLNRGLYGDETDGHVDNVACFAAPGLILMQTCADKYDPNYAISEENIGIIRNSVDSRGCRPELVSIPQPPERFFSGERLTLSYLNFYYVNGGIILPVFGSDAAPEDDKAKGILKELFPNRIIAAVDGMSLITEGGNVHCITQQMPEGLR